MAGERQGEIDRDRARAGVDDVDRRIVAALEADPLATYRAIADAIRVSPRTVQRRYERLRADGLVRVIARPLAGVEGRLSWLLRIATTADAVAATAATLSRVQRVRWVRGTRDARGLICGLVSSPAEIDPALRALPAGATVEVVQLLSTWSGGERRHDALEQRPLDALDRRLIALLEHDGRADAQSLGSLLGVDPTTVLRRRQRLVADRVLAFETDADVDTFAEDADVLLLIDARPGATRSVGDALAATDGVRFVAATSGAHSLAVIVTVPRRVDLLAGLDEVLAVPGATRVEVVPLGRAFKRLAG